MGKRYKRLLALLLALLLTACGAQDGELPPSSGEETVPLSLTVSLPQLPDTLDPAASQGGETALYHLYENLLRWEDGGDGWAALACGQAESYQVETDYAGNATYTFTLREDAKWSDGRAVTAADFVGAWRRLADPANGLPHRELLSAVSGYGQVQETGDASLLAVSAPNPRTFVVTLEGSCAWFLAEVCAGAYTMPAAAGADGAVTNGAYTAAQFDSQQLVLERSESYYGAAEVGPEAIRFVPGSETDYAQFQAGELDLITRLPSEAFQNLPDGWIPEPETSLAAVAFNTRQAPFDDPQVRLAFRLAVNSQAVAEAVDIPTVRPAPGVMPYGVFDYGDRSTPVEPDALPDQMESSAVYWDFRTHSLEKVTVPVESDYLEDSQRARELLVQAGYPGGEGFPAVEYIYIASDEAQAAASALQTIWQRELGISVTLRAVTEETYWDLLAPPVETGEEESEEKQGSGGGEEGEEASGEPEETFAMAAVEIASTVSDAGVLLSRWHSASPDNLSGYRSDAFDILLEAARAAVSPEVRDAYLHDAEAILLEEAPVIPLYCRGGAYLLAEPLAGLYRGPDGVYFLCGVEVHS